MENDDVSTKAKKTKLSNELTRNYERKMGPKSSSGPYVDIFVGIKSRGKEDPQKMRNWSQGKELIQIDNWDRLENEDSHGIYRGCQGLINTQGWKE